MVSTVTVLTHLNTNDTDFEHIYALLVMMHAENAMASLSETRSKEKLRQILRHTGIIGALEDGKIVGVLGLEFQQFWYTDDLHLGEVFCYVHPDHRRQPHAKNLLNAADVGAKKVGVPLLSSVLTATRTAGKCRLFGRFFKPIGQLFIGGECASIFKE